jgi:outer membrane protein
LKKQQRCWALFLPIVLFMSISYIASANPLKLTLDDSIKMALENNYDIKYAKASREKYYWAMEEAKKNKGVSIDYTRTNERYNTPPTQYSPSYSYTTYFDNQVQLTMPLYSSGKLESAIDQSKLNLKVADLAVETARQQLRYEVVSDYFSVLEYRNELQVEQSTVNNYAEHLKVVKEKFDVGLVAKSDVLASEVNLADAQDSLLKAQNNYDNAVATLNNALGVSHNTELILTDNLEHEPYQRTLEECLAYAVVHHPEIEQYQAKIASAQDDIKIAKSGYGPTVDFTAQEDWYDSHFTGDKNNNWLVGVTASINLFDTGLTKTKVNQAEHGLTMVQNQAADSKDTILLNVRKYYNSMQEAKKRIETSQVSVNQAEESLMISKARYDAGIGTNLDVLDAVISLDTAKINYIQALYDYNTYKAELEQAMGVPVS